MTIQVLVAVIVTVRSSPASTEALDSVAAGPPMDT
jgi:hypothetical protein